MSGLLRVLEVVPPLVKGTTLREWEDEIGVSEQNKPLFPNASDGREMDRRLLCMGAGKDRVGHHLTR